MYNYLKSKSFSAIIVLLFPYYCDNIHRPRGHRWSTTHYVITRCFFRKTRDMAVRFTATTAWETNGTMWSFQLFPANNSLTACHTTSVDWTPLLNMKPKSWPKTDSAGPRCPMSSNSSPPLHQKSVRTYVVFE